MSFGALPLSEPVLAIKTSKAWVLPPRPKPGRKPSAREKKRKAKEAMETAIPSALTPKKNDYIVASTSASTGASSATSPIQKLQPMPNHAANVPGTSSAASPLSMPAGTANLLSKSRPLAATTTVSSSQLASEMSRQIQNIEVENLQLKERLLSLIHDYKHLRAAVLAQNNGSVPSLLPGSDDATARKRLYTELDPMNELISNMNELSHAGTPGWESIDLPGINENESELLLPYSKTSASLSSSATLDANELFDFIKLDDEEDQHITIGDNGVDHLDIEEEEEEEGEIHELHGLSRTPLALETDGENSLMTLLTRLTTVLTQNLLMLLFNIEKKSSHSIAYSMALKDQPYLFYLLPPYYGSGQDGFTFDSSLGPVEKLSRALQEDQYNKVTDFLEERLLDNNMEYYTPTREY